jgi:hypothetical protein
MPGDGVDELVERLIGDDQDEGWVDLQGGIVALAAQLPAERRELLAQVLLGGILGRASYGRTTCCTTRSR